MTVSMKTTPEFPPPDRAMKLTLTASLGNHVRLFCTDAPTGSALRSKLDAIQKRLVYNSVTLAHEPSRRRLVVAAVTSGIPFSFAPDVGGKFIFLAQEITRGASVAGGGYQDSPGSAPSETIVGETTLELYVGQRMTLPIGAGADTCTLVLWIWNDRVRATTAAVHGEVSPTLTEVSTSRVRAAIEAPAVMTALSALAGETASAALGDLDATFSDIVSNFNAHLVQAGVHATNDVNNDIAAGAGSQASNDTINEALASFRRHFRNDANDLVSPLLGDGTSSYHSGYFSTPIVASPRNQAERVLAVADLWRAFEAHRISAVHTAPDTVNVLNALAKIPALAAALLTELASVSPTPAAWQSTGAQGLLAIGFQEASLHAQIIKG